MENSHTDVDIYSQTIKCRSRPTQGELLQGPAGMEEGRLHPQLTARSLPARFSAKYIIYYNFFTRLSASIYNDR